MSSKCLQQLLKEIFKFNCKFLRKLVELKYGITINHKFRVQSKLIGSSFISMIN